MPRFVILRHELPADAARRLHWDLMFESGGALRTWSVVDEPGPGVECSAQQLADHRKSYLDYEGPVSLGRGSVARWDAGDYELFESTDGVWRVNVRGGRLCGTISIVRANDSGEEGHSWRVSFGSDPTRG